MTKCYIDIESTGLSPVYDNVTIIGVLSNNKFEQFIDGINLEYNILNDYIVDNEITEIIGYNQIRFDIPFIVQNNYLSQEVVNRLKQTDLMNQCHDIGIKGGLKATEKRLKTERKAEPLNFWQQKSLWKRWQELADKEALDRYKFYNKEDVLNLPRVEQKLIDLKEQKAKQHEKFMRIYREKKGLK